MSWPARPAARRPRRRRCLTCADGACCPRPRRRRPGSGTRRAAGRRRRRRRPLATAPPRSARGPRVRGWRVRLSTTARRGRGEDDAEGDRQPPTPAHHHVEALPGRPCPQHEEHEHRRDVDAVVEVPGQLQDVREEERDDESDDEPGAQPGEMSPCRAGPVRRCSHGDRP